VVWRLYLRGRVAGYTLGAAVLDSDGEAAVAAVLTDALGRWQERLCSTVLVKVSVATSFVLGDNLRGGGRGEAAAGMEEDAAAWHDLLNGGAGDIGLELSEQRRGEVSGRRRSGRKGQR
jgi:hypothetical protein